jgi:glycosyltransferase involved in cell wall biosynthesis
VVVIDDGSSPPARPPTRDPRVRLLRRADAGGVAAARNLGLDHSAGELLCFLDDDDWFYPTKLAAQVEFLARHHQVDLVFSQVVVLEPDGRRGFCLPASHHHEALENLRLFNAIHTNAALFRRAVARSVRFDERLTRFTDTQFFMAAALRFETRYLPVEVAVWNRHVHDRRLTHPDLRASHANLSLLCSIFANVLAAHPDIRALYHRTRDELGLRLLKAAFGLDEGPQGREGSAA